MQILKYPLDIDLTQNEGHATLAGKFLIASPFCQFNEMYSKSVIYVASHAKHGSVGMIINHLINKMSSKHLLTMLRDETEINDLIIPVCLGGPVEPERGFILHTKDYARNVLFSLNDKLNVSSNVDILKDIASGHGPQKSLFVMGYTGWEPGQIEKEIESNLWIVADSDYDLIFNEKHDIKWKAALSSVGINENMFCSQIGRA
jgi:putative transcriptional regulator